MNRPHYENALIVRVKKLVPKDDRKFRYDQINEFETRSSENGIIILKFFLHISQDEKKERVEEYRVFWEQSFDRLEAYLKTVSPKKIAKGKKNELKK